MRLGQELQHSTSRNAGQHSERSLGNITDSLQLLCKMHKHRGTLLAESLRLTGRPTATLSREILLIPALSFTLLLYVNFGNANPPYTVPIARDENFKHAGRRESHVLKRVVA